MSLFCGLTTLRVLISVPKSDFAAYLFAVKKRAADANRPIHMHNVVLSGTLTKHLPHIAFVRRISV